MYIFNCIMNVLWQKTKAINSTIYKHKIAGGKKIKSNLVLIMISNKGSQ